MSVVRFSAACIAALSALAVMTPPAIASEAFVRARSGFTSVRRMAMRSLSELAYFNHCAMLP